MSPILADLDLLATPTRPYKLTMMLGLLTGHLTALAIVDYNVIVSASGTGEVTDSASLGPVLQIDNTRFKLLPEEVEQVRAFLAQFPSPAQTSSSAGHEATAADLPNNSDSGATPLVQGNARGSLESVS